MEIKNCPFCSEEILIEAKKCKHCGEFLDKEMREARQPQVTTEVPKEIVIKQTSSGLVTFLVILAIIALLTIITGL